MQMIWMALALAFSFQYVLYFFDHQFDVSFWTYFSSNWKLNWLACNSTDIYWKLIFLRRLIKLNMRNCMFGTLRSVKNGECMYRSVRMFRLTCDFVCSQME